MKDMIWNKNLMEILLCIKVFRNLKCGVWLGIRQIPKDYTGEKKKNVGSISFKMQYVWGYIPFTRWILLIEKQWGIIRLLTGEEIKSVNIYCWMLPYTGKGVCQKSQWKNEVPVFVEVCLSDDRRPGSDNMAIKEKLIDKVNNFMTSVWAVIMRILFVVAWVSIWTVWKLHGREFWKSLASCKRNWALQHLF